MGLGDTDNVEQRQEIKCEFAKRDRERSIIAGTLMFGAPVLLPIISVCVVRFVQSINLLLDERYQLIVFFNGSLAAAIAAGGTLFVPGRTTRERAVGIVGGAVAGFAIHMVCYRALFALSSE